MNIHLNSFGLSNLVRFKPFSEIYRDRSLSVYFNPLPSTSKKTGRCSLLHWTALFDPEASTIRFIVHFRPFNYGQFSFGTIQFRLVSASNSSRLPVSFIELLSFMNAYERMSTIYRLNSLNEMHWKLNREWFVSRSIDPKSIQIGSNQTGPPKMLHDGCRLDPQSWEFSLSIKSRKDWEGCAFLRKVWIFRTQHR